MKPADLAKRGWRVFPVAGKVPLVKDWPNQATNRALALSALLRKYPTNTGVGIACGTESGIVVIDLDGQTGVDSWEALTAFEECPETFTVVTGRGGLHLYFQHPGVPIRNSVKKLGPSVDVRSDGGFVVGPGSKHPDTGNTYLVKHDVDPAPMPQWLVEKLTEEKPGYQESDSDLDRGQREGTGILAKDGPVSDLLRGDVEVGRRNVAFHAFFTWCGWHIHLPKHLAWEWAMELNDALPVPEDDIESLDGTCTSAYASAPPDKPLAKDQRPPQKQWTAEPPKEKSYRATPLEERLAKKRAEKGSQ